MCINMFTYTYYIYREGRIVHVSIYRLWVGGGYAREPLKLNFRHAEAGSRNPKPKTLNPRPTFRDGLRCFGKGKGPIRAENLKAHAPQKRCFKLHEHGRLSTIWSLAMDPKH